MMGAAVSSPQKMAAAREKLIVALDFATPREAEALVTGLGDTVSFYKIGLELAYGGGRPFAQVAGSGARFLTVHAFPQTMTAAKLAAAGSSLRILGVTVLTSCDDQDLADAGYAYGVRDLVSRRAAQACEAGIDGLI